MRFADRGVLKAGIWADVVVFDPDTIHDVATFGNPNQLSVGMQYVLVNGVPVIDGGKMTNALPGKVVTHYHPTLILCYTDPVAHVKQALAHAKQNLTLVVEEDLVLAARKVALDQGTSVNQLVRNFLATLVEESSRRRMARTRLKAAFAQGLVEIGDRTWSRDDLYER
jgi:hypothetical protein